MELRVEAALGFTLPKNCCLVKDLQNAFHRWPPAHVSHVLTNQKFLYSSVIKKVEASHVQVSNPELCCKGQSRM